MNKQSVNLNEVNARLVIFDIYTRKIVNKAVRGRNNKLYDQNLFECDRNRFKPL